VERGVGSGRESARFEVRSAVIGSKVVAGHRVAASQLVAGPQPRGVEKRVHLLCIERGIRLAASHFRGAHSKPNPSSLSPRDQAREADPAWRAWTGAAVGALVGIIFPPALIGSAVVGAAAGGGIGHALGGMSRGDTKGLRDHLDEGQAGLVVIGESRVGEQLDKALTRAEKS
jgi:hypothetical protein